MVTESGQLRLPSTWGSVPEKSSRRRSPSIVAATRRTTSRSLGRRVVLEHVLGPVDAVGQGGQRGAGAALGVGEDLRHPGPQQLGAVALGELGEAQLADPVGGLLGAQVGEALVRRAHLAGQPLELGGAWRGSAGSRRPRRRGVLEKAGMLPGVGPPTSAWWAREAAKPNSSPAMKTGETRVMSGRWVPPR